MALLDRVLVCVISENEAHCFLCVYFLLKSQLFVAETGDKVSTAIVHCCWDSFNFLHMQTTAILDCGYIHVGILAW